MLKKKNMAMVMAAATVATSVAPVFAAVGTENVDEATMIAKVKKMLDTKYFGTEDSVYTLKIGDAEITEIKDLEVAIATAKINDTTVKVDVIDKGHVVVNGRIVDSVQAKYRLYSAEDLHSDVSEAATTLTNKVVRSVAYYNANGDLVEPSETVVETIMTLVNGKEIKLEVGEKKLNFSKALDANGKEIALPVATTEVGKQIVGFETLETTEDSVKIPSKQLDSLVFNAKEEQEIKVALTDIYNENGYTKKGKEIVDEIIAINGAEEATKQEIHNGKEYKVRKDLISENVSVNKDGKYQVTVTYTYAEGNSTVDLARKGKVAKLVITSDSNKDLNTVLADLKKTTGTVTEGKGKYTTLAGEDRFETAVEISKASFTKHDAAELEDGKPKANSVVLVGQDAIVDGLAAAPLAKQKNAPILLANKSSLDKKTMDEIKRILPKNSTVYIVGGEYVISKDVEAQLISELNAKIVRLAGDDRYETSVKIAENMKKVEGSTMAQAFVVGGYGEADAMSIAAVAANKTTGDDITPIIVSPEAGLNQGAQDFLYTNKAGLTNVDVVGGVYRVSKQVEKDIKANLESADVVVRVAGEDRNETNAMVINKFYKKTTEGTGLTGVYVAKDGMTKTDQLIDALAVAPLAGRTATPIVLATENLTEEQVTAVEKNKAVLAEDAKHTMTVAGHGIADAIIAKLAKLLSL